MPSGYEFPNSFSESKSKRKSMKGLDNGVLDHPSNKRTSGANVDFPAMVDYGENPNGFVAFTPNGISRNEERGMNKQWNWGGSAMGERWGGPDNGCTEWNGDRSGE